MGYGIAIICGITMLIVMSLSGNMPMSSVLGLLEQLDLQQSELDSLQKRLEYQLDYLQKRMKYMRYSQFLLFLGMITLGVSDLLRVLS